MEKSVPNKKLDFINLKEEPCSVSAAPRHSIHSVYAKDNISIRRPFLGLRAKLSLAFFTSPSVIYLLFSAWHLYRARLSVQTIVFNSKASIVENCQDLERSISVFASLPEMAAEVTHHTLVIGIDSAIQQVSQGLLMVLQGVLETIEFIVAFLTGTWRCFLVHLADSGIPMLSDIGDGGVLAIDQLTEALMVLLTAPFNELGVLIQQEMTNTLEFREAISKISIQPMNKIEFCPGTVESLSVEALTSDFKRWILYGAIGILGVAVIGVLANMVLAWYQHRRWKIHVGRIAHQLSGLISTPPNTATIENVIHDPTSTPPRPQASLRATAASKSTTTAVHIDQLAHHPTLFHFVNSFSRRLFPNNEQRRNGILWLATYITHPPAMTCLIIGILGVALVYAQIAALNYARTHYSPSVFQPALRDLSRTIVTEIRESMTRSSAKFAHDTNLEIEQLETHFNQNIFGAIVHATKEMSTVLTEAQTSLERGVEGIFGGLFGALVMAVLSCLLLNKLGKVKAALIWVQGHAQMSLPRLSPEVLILSQARVDKMLQVTMASSSLLLDRGGGVGNTTFGDERGGRTVGGQAVGVLVTRILDEYEDQIRQELPVYYSLLAVWGVIVVLGFGRSMFVCFQRAPNRVNAREQV
ncbi:plasma membrane fusion protein prm1 [Podila humilis]|nr:plasma membrane fusion protein prm1 [Podila humilis]